MLIVFVDQGVLWVINLPAFFGLVNEELTQSITSQALEHITQYCIRLETFVMRGGFSVELSSPHKYYADIYQENQSPVEILLYRMFVLCVSRHSSFYALYCIVCLIQ